MRSEEARARMRAAWTPERRAAQAERARRPGRLHPRKWATMQAWKRIRGRRREWRRIRRCSTTVPYLLDGVVVYVVVATTRHGRVGVETRWRGVKVRDGERQPRWTLEARREQAARMLKVRNNGGASQAVLDRMAAESVRRRRLRGQWSPGKRRALSVAKKQYWRQVGGL